MDQLTCRSLIERAAQVRENARVPFSGFKVGAAVLAENGVIYVGCNMEISNMMQSVCAEQAALAHATAEGQNKFVALAVIGDTEQPISPCGRCRQMLVDFGYDWEIIMATTRNDQVRILSARELLPYAFAGSRTKKNSPST
jgi:cytidine deaminase